MVDGEIGKGLFLEGGQSPPKCHVAFVNFLQALNDRDEPDRTRIAHLTDSNGRRLRKLGVTNTSRPDLQKLAPLAGDPDPIRNTLGRGPARPFARDSSFCGLVDRGWIGKGRQFMKFIDLAVREFPNYA